VPAGSSSQGETPGSRDAAFYWGFVALLVAGVFALPGFPSQDGPSHLYSFGLIDSLMAGDPERGAFFRFEIDSPTNIALPLLGSLLIQIVPPGLLERFLIALHVVAVACFSVGWRRVHDRAPYPAAWAGLAFAFPWALFMGFYSFQLASDLALLLLIPAQRTAASGRSSVGSLLLASLASGCLILLVHAVAALLFALVLALCFVCEPSRALGGRLFRGAVVSLPTLAVIGWALSGGDASGTADWRWADFSYAFVYFTTLGGFVFPGQWLPGALIAGVFVFCCVRGGGLSRLPLVAAAAAMLSALHFLLPDFAGGGGYLTGRFAWWIPLLLLPAFEVGPRLRWLGPALAFLSLGTTLLIAWPHALQVGEIQRTARDHGVAGRISAALFDRAPRSNANLEPLRHVVAWFAMDDGLLITHYQARERFFPVRFAPRARREWPDVDINYAWESDWARLPLDALLAVDANEDDRGRLRRNFDSVWIDSAKRVELWRRK